MHHQQVRLLEARLLALEIIRIAIVLERKALLGLVVEALCVGDGREIMSARNRIEVLAIEIRDRDAVPGLAQRARADIPQRRTERGRLGIGVNDVGVHDASFLGVLALFVAGA